ncbi:Cell division coordinator CpoB [Gammaproteobacteria bacterium]
MALPWRIATGLIVALALHFGAQAAAPVASPSNIEGINQTVMDLLRQMETLQQEVQQLRGDVELHTHTLETMKASQRQMYLDMERRAGTAAVASPSFPPATMTPPALPVAPVAPAVVAPPSVQASRQPVAANPSGPEEQAAYDTAFSLLRSGSYDEAIKSFRGFLSTYSQGQLAANSQYWIGEAYYVTRRFKEAMVEFQRALDGYPSSAKAGDALLKLGYIQYELNQTAEARKSLEEVIARFPQSTAAQLASTRLAKMKR